MKIKEQARIQMDLDPSVLKIYKNKLIIGYDFPDSDNRHFTNGLVAIDILDTENNEKKRYLNTTLAYPTEIQGVTCIECNDHFIFSGHSSKGGIQKWDKNNHFTSKKISTEDGVQFIKAMKLHNDCLFYYNHVGNQYMFNLKDHTTKVMINYVNEDEPQKKEDQIVIYSNTGAYICRSYIENNTLFLSIERPFSTKAIWEFKYEDEITNIAIDPFERYIILSNKNNQLLILDLLTGHIINKLILNEMTDHLSISECGKYIIRIFNTVIGLKRLNNPYTIALYSIKDISFLTSINIDSGHIGDVTMGKNGQIFLSWSGTLEGKLYNELIIYKIS